MKKEQVKELLTENFEEDFMFLVSYSYLRWYRIQDLFEIGFGTEFEEDRIASKQLFLHLAKITRKFKDREKWAELFERYNLILQSENKEPPKGYVNIYNLYLKVLDLIKKNVKNLQKNEMSNP